MNSPELVVFDLDFTLWDCGGTYCDCLQPPFSRTRDLVLDRDERVVSLYADVIPILNKCDGLGIPMALASRTEQPKWAEQLVDLLNISHRFKFVEIFPDSKIKHFNALHDVSGISFKQMLFFDDEQRNIQEVSTLGVTSVFVPRGINATLFDAGLRQFSQN